MIDDNQYISYLKERDIAKYVVYKRLDKFPDLGTMPTCPNCGVAMIDCFGKGEFCANCGQRLKWNDK